MPACLPPAAYTGINKPVAVVDWLAKTEVREDYILVIDADMIMRRPVLPQVGATLRCAALRCVAWRCGASTLAGMCMDAPLHALIGDGPKP